MKTKYEQFIEIIEECNGTTLDLTADTLETLVYKGVVDETDIDAVIEAGEDVYDIVSNIISIVSVYEDFMEGYNQDEAENCERKNSDEY